MSADSALLLLHHVTLITIIIYFNLKRLRCIFCHLIYLTNYTSLPLDLSSPPLLSLPPPSLTSLPLPSIAQSQC